VAAPTLRLMGEFHCGVIEPTIECGMNRADQSSAWTNTNADRALEILEERQAELLRLRDEVKQLSWKLQPLNESQFKQTEKRGQRQ
jgi:hypothetical protein